MTRSLEDEIQPTVTGMDEQQNGQEQEIPGTTRQEALQILASLQGVKQSAISFDGFGDANRLPKQSSFIHIALVVV